MAINVKDKLITLESLGVAYSAEQDAREEADQALSTRIDNIVAPEGDPSLTEVADAFFGSSEIVGNLIHGFQQFTDRFTVHVKCESHLEQCIP